jgi:hypothetical protein
MDLNNYYVKTFTSFLIIFIVIWFVKFYILKRRDSISLLRAFFMSLLVSI